MFPCTYKSCVLLLSIRVLWSCQYFAEVWSLDCCGTCHMVMERNGQIACNCKVKNSTSPQSHAETKARLILGVALAVTTADYQVST
jgi:hypothetical protein